MDTYFEGGEQIQMDSQPKKRPMTRKYEKEDLMLDLQELFTSDVSEAYGRGKSRYEYFDTRLERMVSIHEMVILLANGLVLPSIVKVASGVTSHVAYFEMFFKKLAGDTYYEDFYRDCHLNGPSW